MDVSGAIRLASAAEFEDWLRSNGPTEREVVVAILKKSTGRQTVELTGLQEAALCYGWVDTQSLRIDEEWYALRFVPRRPHSNWSESNRAMARRLITEGRLSDAGRAALPADL